MITPILIAGIFFIISENVSKRVVQYSLSALLILPGLILIFLRAGDLIANTDCRDNSKIPELINNQSNQKIITPFKYYFFAEDEKREVITFERSKVDAEVLIKDADLIISSNWRADFLKSHNFREVSKIHCNPGKVPFLPGSFYERSTFSETFYKR